MNFKKAFLSFSVCCVCFISKGISQETKTDNLKDTTTKKTTVSLSVSPQFSVGYLNLNNSIVNNGLDIDFNLLFNSTKEKKQQFKIGFGYNYQYLTINSDKLLFANKDSLWFKNTGANLKTNRLALFYFTVPLIYSNQLSSNFKFQVGVNNKFLFLHENYIEENLPYSTRTTEKMYQNTNFNSYQAEAFVRVGIYKSLYVEFKQSITKVSNYSNFSNRPYSFSLGINL